MDRPPCLPTPARIRSGFCSTGSASATKASSPIAMSHRTSRAQATIASPRWAAGGPSGGAGSRKSASYASPPARTAGIAGSVNGSVSNRVPVASTHSSVWLVSVLPEPLRCVSLLRCSTSRSPTSRITAPRAWTASVAWTLSLPSITPPTRIGPVELDLPDHVAGARLDELRDGHPVQRVRARRPGEPGPVDRAERLRRAARVADVAREPGGSEGEGHGRSPRISRARAR